MTDNQRAAFEACASKKWPGASFAPDQNNCGIVVTERYKHPKLQTAWEAYQAAFESPQVQDLKDALQSILYDMEAEGRGTGYEYQNAQAVLAAMEAYDE